MDLDPLDSDGHSLEFLVKRVDSSKWKINRLFPFEENVSTFRNAELLYIIEAARKQREEEDIAAGG